MFGREIASQTTRGMLNGNNNALYSDQSMSLSSGPNSPITSNGYNHQLETYFEKQDHQLPKNLQSNSDRFEAMFLSSTPPSQDLDTKEKPLTPTKRPAQRTQKQQQFRFKKSPSQNTAAAAASTGTTAPSQNQHPLDFLVLSRHNMEIELATTAAFSSANPSSAGSKRKSKQKAPANSKKALGKKPSTIMENTTSSYDRQHSDSDNDDHDEDEDELNGEDAPVFGDGAQSYSSMGSSSSRTSQQTLTKDDKRRRNTAASARFRIKKKMREQALQSTACEMTDKAQRMEQRVHELEREIKWLKALVVEKNEARLEQLVRERPPNSTAFPMPLSQSYQQQQQQQQENHLHQQQQQQQQQSNGSRRISRNSRQRSTKNEDYENEDDRPYQNDQY
jgi:hypothetical protein